MERSFPHPASRLLDQLALQIQQIPSDPGEQATWTQKLQDGLLQLSAERAGLQSNIEQARAELEHSRAACQIMQGENERLALTG